MTQADETRAAVEGYFAAWTSHRPDEAFGFLAPNLQFAGPTAAYDTRFDATELRKLLGAR